MAKKSIVEQIQETQDELEKAMTKKKQYERQLEKLKQANRAKEQRLRTRRLIQKGAILESINQDLAELEGEKLKACLLQIFGNENSKEIIKNYV